MSQFEKELEKFKEREAAGEIREYVPKIGEIPEASWPEEDAKSSGTLWKLTAQDVAEPGMKVEKGKNAFVWPKTLELNPKKMSRMAALLEASLAMEDRWLDAKRRHGDTLMGNDELTPVVRRYLACQIERSYQQGMSAAIAAIFDDDRDHGTFEKLTRWVKSLRKK